MELQEEKKTGWGKRTLIVILVVLLFLLAAVIGVVNYVLGRLGDTEDLEGTVPEESTYWTDPIVGVETMPTLTDEEVEFQEIDLLGGEDMIHILLIGQDARPGELRARSDAMIVVTLNTKRNAIQLTSFMRDTYVQIPGWANNKLNAPFRYEGVDLLNETIKLNFGLEIDGNVVVNFNDFQTIFDLLGGVDVEMNQEEAAYMNRHGCKATVGVNHLDGNAALTFCRVRYISRGDYARTERQQKVVAAVMQAVADQGMEGLLTVIQEVLPYVYTNLSNPQIINYATVGLEMLAGGAEIQTLRIPADDAHYDAMIDSMSCLVPDLPACQEDLREFFYGTEEE